MLFCADHDLGSIFWTQPTLDSEISNWGGLHSAAAAALSWLGARVGTYDDEYDIGIAPTRSENILAHYF